WVDNDDDDSGLMMMMTVVMVLWVDDDGCGMLMKKRRAYCTQRKSRSLKNKDQVAANEELARQLDGEMQAEIAEEERIKRQKEEEANIALIES
ncbi:hypothetical protein Tco_0055703, partial [Tanacetum coccineum]